MKIVAIEDKVIVEVAAKEEKTESGLIIPEVAQNPVPQTYGKVISVGTKADENIKEGDLIMFHERGGMDIFINRKVHKVLKSDEIYAAIKDAEGTLISF